MTMWAWIFFGIGIASVLTAFIATLRADRLGRNYADLRGRMHKLEMSLQHTRGSLHRMADLAQERRTALRDIAGMETPAANATVRRMAARAREAIGPVIGGSGDFTVTHGKKPGDFTVVKND